MVVASRPMRRILEMAKRAGAGEGKVLITGESGVGKELIARLVHDSSARAGRPFIAVNCAGVPETLLEPELFGARRGSYTGADRDRPGMLQLASGGTLFLDEVGEMSLRMQALLLRFLDKGEIQTVGESVSRTVDVRIVAATNRNLAERVAAGEFRSDLMYRLRVIHLAVPPLRERPEDIPALIEHFLRRAPKPIVCSAEAKAALLKYRWPGNVRELQNIIEQAVWTANTSVIGLTDLPEAIGSESRVTVVSRERRRQMADQLFDALVNKQYSFWEHVYPLFLSRDLTRHDIRELVRRGLSATKGNYRALLPLFGMDKSEYFRFHNFLTAHNCKIDYRAYRRGVPADSARSSQLPPGW
jgi:transcriptional regulator with PAS, ATPase and Fis domain